MVAGGRQELRKVSQRLIDSGATTVTGDGERSLSPVLCDAKRIVSAKSNFIKLCSVFLLIALFSEPFTFWFHLV